MATPARTSVLAVGIESYAVGERMSLPGVAGQALRFAQWAKHCQVPAERIRLACSWTGDEPEGLLKDGFRLVEPTRTGIEDELFTLMAEGGDLLLIYWCGHGVTVDRSRVLFTADATQASRRNLAVDEICRVLSSREGDEGFAQQAIVIDACANFVEDLALGRELPSGRLGGESPRSAQQFVLFATPLGRAARYDPMARESMFSAQVLRYLEEAGTELPPDMTDLHRQVAAALSADHQPTSLFVKRYDESVEDVAYGPGLALTPSQQARLLSDAMTNSVLDHPEVLPEILTALGQPAQPLDREAVKRAARRAIARGDAQTLVDALAGKALSSEDLASILRLRANLERQLRIAEPLRRLGAMRLAEVLRAHRQALAVSGIVATRNIEDLADALDDAAGRCDLLDPAAPLHTLVALLECYTGHRMDDRWFPMDADRLAELRASVARVFVDRDASARLVIDLRPEAPGAVASTWPQDATWYLFHDGVWWREEVKCGPSDADAHAVVQKVISAVESIPNLTIGLVVPRKLQDRRPEQWEVERSLAFPDPLNLTYPVVLHGGERFSAREGVRTSWVQALARVRGRLNSVGCDVEWLPNVGGMRRNAFQASARAAQGAVVGLQFVPPPVPDDIRADPIIAAIAAGAPFVAWFQQEPADWDAARAAADRVFSTGAAADLPHRLLTYRQSCGENGHASAGHDLRVVWDDDLILPPVIRLCGANTLAAAGTITREGDLT